MCFLLLVPASTIVVVVDDQTVFTDHTQTDEKSVDSIDTKLTKNSFGNSECGVQMFVLAASVSAPGNVKPTSVGLMLFLRFDPPLVEH